MTPRQDVCYRTAAGLEDAGLDLSFSPIYWTYATGFPKAMKLGDGSYSGMQLKPAVEVVSVAMKPLAEKTYKAQALSNGHGCTWLDDCRIPFPDSQGSRFPANLLVSDAALGAYSRFFSLDAWAERTLPFLIVPKPSQREKNHGLEGANPHGTVKPIQLMSYLITMGSRPGDTVLDCFLGSGTTGIAAAQLDRRFIGIELDPQYFETAKKRIDAWKDKIAWKEGA
jgi:site-specific DNA-methyltransferase (adenine-specific)